MRQLALLWGATALAALALLPLSARLAPFLPVCPVRRFVGLPCPTCGSGRAIVALADLRPLAALAANPLVTLLAATFFLGGVAVAGLALAGRLPREPRALPASARWWTVTLVAANWIYLWGVGR